MLHVEHLVKTFEGDHGRGWRKRLEADRVRAVDDVSFDVTDGQLFTLLGPSGCGKTTTLRSLAGLEHPDSGTIRLGDRELFSRGGNGAVNVPANRRGLGMVFQSYAIWPHMNVFDNVAFPLKVRKRSERPSRSDMHRKVTRVLETMELAHLSDRQATKLSGGQQQRLALARAIVTEPPLMLLDEPLSNLDAKLRESLRFELKRLQRELGITSVYVTHDQIEALALSSVVGVMREGKILQVGKPREIYQNPNCRFVAEFIGTSNFITGVVATHEGGRSYVDTSEGQLVLEDAPQVPVGTEVVVSARPEALTVAESSAGGGVPNEWRGEVLTRAFLGDSVDHIVSVGKYEIRVRANPALSIPPGTEVYLRMEPSRLILVPLDA
ncbi:MAG: ABC transporter ATP-binding protein [Carbonactinosporaceae bacterium]